MTPLTVACVFVRGEYPYTVEYVARLREMVRRWIDRPFTFVCLTDRPLEMPLGVEAVRVEKPAESATWTKLELFNPARAWPGRVLYLDLDVLLVASLAPILDWPESFAITDDPPGAHKPRTVDRFGRAIVRRFNSSVMVWDGGTQTDLFMAWTPADAERLSGDQDWLGERRPDASAMPRAWFPRISEAIEPPWPGDAKVILTKHPKNHLLALRHRWFGPLWGGA
jgi:hypothetical protein